MKPNIIKKSLVPTKDLGVIKIKELFAKAECPEYSASLVQLDGINSKTINTKSDLFYFVHTGSGCFTLDGVKQSVAKGDLVYVPKGTEYFDEGKMTLLVFHSPRFDIESVTIINT